jgi:hypothetical protein
MAVQAVPVVDSADHPDASIFDAVVVSPAGFEPATY